MLKRFFKHFRRKFGTGLVTILPIFITAWILYLVFSLIDSWVTPSLMKLLTMLNVPFINTIQARILVPVIGLIVLVLIIYLLGLIGSHYIGGGIGRLIEERIMKVPMVKSIYGSSKQILEAFSPTGEKAFRNVVIFEYPRRGIYVLGFLATEKGNIFSGLSEDEMMGVFLPTTPNPTSGFFLLIPKKDLVVLDMSIEEGLKMIVSGGLIRPEKFEVKMIE